MIDNSYKYSKQSKSMKRLQWIYNFLWRISSQRLKRHVINYSLLAILISQINILHIYFNDFSLEGNWGKYSMILIYFTVYFLCVSIYSQHYYQLSSFKDYFKSINRYTFFYNIFLLAELSLLIGIDTDDFVIGFWIMSFLILLLSGIGVSLITAIICSLIQKIKQKNIQIGNLEIDRIKNTEYNRTIKKYFYFSMILCAVIFTSIDFIKIQKMKMDLRTQFDGNKNSERTKEIYEIQYIYKGNNKYHIPCIIVETTELLSNDQISNIQKRLHKEFSDKGSIVRSLFKNKGESYAIAHSTIKDFKYESKIQLIKDINEKYSFVVKDFIQKKAKSDIKDHEIYGIYYNIGDCSKLNIEHPNYLTIITYDSLNNYFYSNFKTVIVDLKPIIFDGKKFIKDKQVFQGIATPSVSAQDQYILNEYHDLLNKDLYHVDAKSEKYEKYLHRLEY